MVGPIVAARPVDPHGGLSSPPDGLFPFYSGEAAGVAATSHRASGDLTAVIETASDRQAWSLSRIGLAGSRASLARASTSFAQRSAGLVAASGGLLRPGSFLSSLS